MNQNKVALVTGGSRGIGRGICVEVAKAGYAVVVNFRDNFTAAQETQQLVEEFDVPADICQGDVTVQSDRDLIVDFALERFGRIDLLVNNAGIAQAERKDILEYDAESFDQVLNVNLRAPYFFTQRVAKVMIDLISSKTIETANIVNITSLRSYTAAKNYGEYCISKAGLSMATKLFAVRLAEHGINVFEVSPGIIETDMTGTKATRDYYNNKIASGLAPINRWGKPEEVGRAVAAIARGDFPFSTGLALHIDGGWHLREL